jgi:hypothetical protein
LLQVHGKAALTSVQSKEEEALTTDEGVWSRPGPFPSARLGPLYLDDIGSQIGHQLHSRGPDADLGEAEDPHAVEDAFGGLRWQDWFLWLKDGSADFKAWLVSQPKGSRVRDQVCPEGAPSV